MTRTFDIKQVAYLVDNLKIKAIGGVGVETTHSPLGGATNAYLSVRHVTAFHVVRHTHAYTALHLQLSRCLNHK